MKHAYLILAHHEPEVLRLLLTLIDDARNDIYLHIDARSQQLYDEFKDWQPRSARFFLLSQREKSDWGQVSIVRAELLLFSAAKRVLCLLSSALGNGSSFEVAR